MNDGCVANSPLIGQIEFEQGSTLRMSTVKNYDYLNRLQSISSSPSSSSSFSYQYNDANQRTRVTLADGSYWLYEYDLLGQVKSGKRYWSDHTPVAGQQFEYGFDDIGNRTTAKSGGDANGVNLRSATYTANSRNQYTSRTVPAGGTSGGKDIVGLGNANATVTMNSNSTYRKGEYFLGILALDNTSSAVWQGVTVTAVSGGSSNTVSGNTFTPKTPENYTYDADGNTLTDGRWSSTWDVENRLTVMQGISGLPSDANLYLEFENDYQGRRISKKSYSWNGSSYVLQYQRKFLYDGWNVVAELQCDAGWGHWGQLLTINN